MSANDAPYRPLPAWYWLIERLWRVERALAEAKARRSDQDTPIRIFFVLVIFAAAFGALAVGAATRALSNADERALYFSGAVERADLTDRNGQLLAVDLTHFGVYLDPREVWDAAETRRVLAAALPDVPANRLERALRGEKRAYLTGGLTPQARQRLHDLGLPGVSFEEEDKRVYPLGASAAHLVGFTDKGGQGLSGAELALDELIREEGKKGRPVALSIDMRVQAALEDEVQKAVAKHSAKGGIGVVTDVHTGEILGMASAPDFDPNQAGRSDPNGLTDRAAASVFEVGSIFKIFSVALALDSGVVKVNSTIDARGGLHLGSRTIHDYHAENRVMTIADVFIHSSNIGVARLGLMAGPETLQRYYKDLGLLDPAEVELAESAKPIVPRRWDDNAVTSSTFGHAVSITPLMMVQAMNAVFNGGEFIPLTIRKMEPGDRPKGKRVLRPETSRAMLDLMRLNVTGGTGGKANAPGLRVGGKTGSAEKAMGGRYVRDKLISSFAAVFPTDGPVETKRYAVLIMLDEPRGTPDTFGFATGGWTATPAAGRVIDRIAPFLEVRRAPPTPAELEKARGGAAPAVVEEAR